MNVAAAESYFDDLLRHENWARRLAFRLVRDAAAADDLVQDAFLAALRQRPETRSSFRPWLAGVLKNLSRLHWRSSAARSRREAASTPGATALDPAKMTERLDTHRRLAEAVGMLSEDLKSVVVLRYYEDLNSTEIGRRLGVPPATVRWRLAKALSEIRGRFEGEEGSGLLWVMPLLPLAAACSGARDWLRGVGSPPIVGAPAASTALGSLAKSAPLAWAVAATGVITTVWLVNEVAHLTDLLENRPPVAPEVAAREVADLRRGLEREKARGAALSRELAAARKPAPGKSAAGPGEENAAARETAASRGLSEELLAKVRELSILVKEMEELAGQGAAFGTENFLPGSPPPDDPEARALSERQAALMQKLAMQMMPILEDPATLEDFLVSLEKEREPYLMHALIAVIGSKSVGVRLSQGRLPEELSDRFVALFADPTVDATTRSMLLALIDLRRGSGRALTHEVMELARSSTDPALREAALGALAMVRDETAVSILKQTAETDQSLRTRVVAVSSLGAYYRGTNDEEALRYLDWLKERTDAPLLGQAIDAARTEVAGTR